jgi:enoyl-CoA hydratase/carnithine racemase
MTPSGTAITHKPVLTWEEHDGVLHAVFCAPPANALGPELVDALTRLVDEFEHGAAKVLVLSSAVPGFFAAGADIKHVATLDTEAFADYRDAARVPIERLAFSCRRPSIALVEGRALGGGLELAMACTLRVASHAARLSLPEVKLGLIPGAGGTQRLPRLVGRGRALEILLTGREVDAEEAARIGLVDRLVEDDDALGATLALARRMARASGPAMAAIMQCVDVALDMPLERGMAVEGVALLSTFDEGEGREGIAAFVEKRAPDFA